MLRLEGVGRVEDGGRPDKVIDREELPRNRMGLNLMRELRCRFCCPDIDEWRRDWLLRLGPWTIACAECPCLDGSIVHTPPVLRSLQHPTKKPLTDGLRERVSWPRSCLNSDPPTMDNHRGGGHYAPAMATAGSAAAEMTP